MHRIVLTAKASREYKKLPEQAVSFVNAAIDHLALDPFSKSLDIKKLKSPFNGYRLREREWRILYTVDRKIIEIYSIKNRRDAYK